jgi:hypothetical protein
MEHGRSRYMFVLPDIGDFPPPLQADPAGGWML